MTHRLASLRAGLCRARGAAMVLVLLASLPAHDAAIAATGGKSVLRLLAASTLVETGLPEELARRYESRHPEVAVRIVESGALAVLDHARRGEADLVLTHHPAGEKIFVDEGYGLLRTELLYDQTAFFGPPRDPLGLAHLADVNEVLRRLKEREAPFLAPAPQSGTYKKLMTLFELAGVTPDWFGLENTGASATATLRQAAQFGAYTFANLGVYLANRDAIGTSIVPLFRDHPALRNTYSAIVVNRERVPQANQAEAERFHEFLVSAEGQDVIRDFGDKKFGVPLFTPIADLDEGLRARRAAADLNRRWLITVGLLVLLVLLAALSAAAVRQMRRARRAEAERRRSEERFALAVSGTNDGLWDWNLATGEAWYSPRWKEMLGYRGYDDELEGHMRTWRERIHPEDREHVLAVLDNYLAGHSELLSVEHRIQTRTGGYLWVLLRGKAQWGRRGPAAAVDEPLRLSGSLTDIAEHKCQEEALKHQALHDTLTGLPNRTLLEELLARVLAQARHDNQPLAVALLDLEKFREINETFGHPRGDAVLQEVAKRLADRLAEPCAVARFGGDVFALILPETDAGHTGQIVYETVKALEPPFTLGAHVFPLKARLGFALFPPHGADATALLQRAEVALYRAKRQNLGHAVYDPDLDQNSPRYLAFEAELRQAVARNEFVVYYQPMMNLRTGYIGGVEALLRWQHPRHGLILPEAFVPQAESLNLLGLPTDWLLEQALRQCVAWHAAGHKLTVSVNLSASGLHDAGLPERIAESLRRADAQAPWLELEITESAIMTDPARARQNLARLRTMKIGLVIDDFGTGYASLSYLKNLPVNKVKIDKSFVTDMDEDEGDVAIVRATIVLAHNLGIKVTAEGVENEDVLKRLAIYGCDHAQGYHICAPMPGEDLLEWLERAGWEGTDAPGEAPARRG